MRMGLCCMGGGCGFQVLVSVENDNLGLGWVGHLFGVEAMP